MDDLKDLLFGWALIVGGFALFLFTIRLLGWLVEVILLGRWF